MRVAQQEPNLEPAPREQARGLLVVGELAGVNSAASGIQTAATVVTRCSFQP